MDELTRQGIDAFRAGKRDEARKLLLSAVEQNPDSEDAWGWLYNAAENDRERIYCLTQVLRINPSNNKVNQLYKSLLDKQSQLENNQKHASRQVAQKVPNAARSAKLRPVKRNKPANKNSNRFIIGALVSILFCVCGFFAISVSFNPSSGVATKTLSASGVTTKILSAAETFEVSAVDVVKDEGYTVTSAICEVVSPERNVISGIDLGKIVFHAFRITHSSLGREVIVLFASNHTAEDGSGLVFTVNTEAARLFPDFPDKSRHPEHPITTNTPGAQKALECARQAGAPPSLNLGDFDAEAWRRETIEKYGPEQTYDDGSKQDYVRLALSICEYKESHPSMVYEADSFQQYILDTFCPYVE